MGKVKHEVVGVCDLELLDTLRLVSDLADSALNVVLSLHESLVLSLDLTDDVLGVDVAFPVGPVNSGELALVGRRFVEELKNRLDLAKLITAIMSVSGQSQAVDPLVGQVLVLLGIVDDSSATRGSAGR